MQDNPAKHWTRRPVPLNFRTVVFCLLEGLVLSLPVGSAIPAEFHVTFAFRAPDWVRPCVGIGYLGAIVLLPIWSLFLLRPFPGLRTAGVLTFIFILILGLVLPST